MSASREKKARQERGAEQLTPQQQKALDEKNSVRRMTVIFAVCAVLLLAGVAARLVWSSGVIQRNAAAVSVNGQTYTAADFSYYYYNSRSNVMNNGSTTNIDVNKSLREQDYDGSQTWFDQLSGTSIDTLARAALASQAAKAAGFNGDEEYEKNVSETLDALESGAKNSGYPVNQYIKMLYGPLMTKSIFERNLRMAALAESYYEVVSEPENYSSEQLDATYAADPNEFCTVDYEYALFFTDSSAEDAQAALDATKTSADAALALVQGGTSMEAAAASTGGSYGRTDAFFSTTSGDMANWLFDDARKDGDAAVFAYYDSGYWTVVFHSKSRADFHAVDVRHILVDDEAKANDILAQFNAGDRSEDSFAALAQENSTDNAEAGGLYTDVRPGQMVDTFDAWCFDSARQPGDTGVVQTDYGYHVMYFVRSNPYAYWQQLAAAKLGSDWSKSLSSGKVTEVLPGMKYVDP